MFGRDEMPVEDVSVAALSRSPKPLDCEISYLSILAVAVHKHQQRRCRFAIRLRSPSPGVLREVGRSPRGSAPGLRARRARDDRDPGLPRNDRGRTGPRRRGDRELLQEGVSDAWTVCLRCGSFCSGARPGDRSLRELPRRDAAREGQRLHLPAAADHVEEDPPDHSSGLHPRAACSP